MSFTHRLAQLEDLPAIVDIYNSTITSRAITADLEPVTVAARTPWFQAHDPQTRPIWVVEHDKRVVAWLSFSNFNPRAAYRHTAEISLYVDETMRGYGCGRYLLMQAIAAAPTLHVHTLVGLIFGQNEPSLGLFASCGFVRWAQMPRIALMEDVELDLVIVGRRVDA
ncbi:GNAT family N-acetyltransferase [uncultured Oxalicibacterium sp.]|uniref:GNAT family N-acetyltransferase n=1 Tax=uncultured Oxalicibacterium sp. TaxID=1168540 RepID=UPI0025D9DB7F|nr:GNAT family N-acetyltransferase [uncultured Oxalicibacterium sp.]